MKSFVEAVNDADYMRNTARAKTLDMCRTLGEIATLYAMSFPVGTTVITEQAVSASCTKDWRFTVMFVNFDEQNTPHLTLVGSPRELRDLHDRNDPSGYVAFMGNEPGSVYPMTVRRREGELFVTSLEEASVEDYIAFASMLSQLELAFKKERAAQLERVNKVSALVAKFFDATEDAD